MRTRTTWGRGNGLSDADAKQGQVPSEPLGDSHYRLLSAFRYELRCFLVFSEKEARAAGLTPQQHQALLAIRGSDQGTMSVGELADRLVIEPHSASGLASRLCKAGLLARSTGKDRRSSNLRLTGHAEQLLEQLSRVHHLEIRRIGQVLQTLLERSEEARQDGAD